MYYFINNFRKFLVAFIVFTLISTPTSAIAGGTSTPFKIVKLSTREFNIDVFTDQPVSSSMGCSRSDAVRIVVTASNYAAISSMLMTAFASGKTVTVFVDSCDTDGVGKFIAASVEY